MSVLWIMLGIVFGLTAGILTTWAVMQLRVRRLVRERRIRDHIFPEQLLQAVRADYPHLQASDLAWVSRALLAFFVVHLHAGSRAVAMPSRVADALWRHFTLDTEAYGRFCREAFGRLLHRTPSASSPVASTRASHAAALLETSRLACWEENIDPQEPTRLPLLFALDAKLAIPNGLEHRLADFQGRRTTDRGDDGGDMAALPVIASFGSSHTPNADDASNSADGADGGDAGGGD
ncbi:MAG: hypothetical protein RI988_1411 [Pseudomonadota bacterium]|jgi:hypothetical protein